MTIYRLKSLIAFSLMISFAAIGYLARPTSYMADTRPKFELANIFPKTFGGWTTDENTPAQLVSPDLLASLNAIYNQVLSRTYVDSRGRRIMLSVAYGGDQSDGTSAHRPEVCYPAQGFEIIASEEASLNTNTHPVRVRHLVARLGARVEPITYWIVVGDKIAITGAQQKWAQMQYGVHGVIPDGMLVRISSIGDDANSAYALQSSFVQELLRSVQPELRVRIIGVPEAS